MLPVHAPSKIGRYEIKSLIGAGGMGTLYLARDTNPNTYRLVALKLLNANLDSDELRERFGREARALAALNHPNVVNIFDSGEFQFSPFIVMEYVRGETLAEKIKRKAPLTLAQKLKMMVELCAGLAHAHEAGIIHRDIKPANLMVDQHGRLKLLDFGIARVHEFGLTRAGVQMTQVNVRIGTPGYMSPEQIEGLEIDRRSDIFAIGAVLYELLSYREAFTGVNTRQIENQVLHAHPTRLVSVIPDLDPEIEAIVIRALEKDPNHRYQEASELENALERQLWRLGPAETPLPTQRSTPAPAQTPGRKSQGSRAEIAYERALAVYEQGASEAAKRFAIEALAEDPAHEGARALLRELDPRAWVPEPPAARAPVPPTMVAPRDDFGFSAPAPPTYTPPVEGTIVSTRGGLGSRAASAPDAATVISTRTQPSGWSIADRFGLARAPWLVPALAAAVLVVVTVGVVLLVAQLMGWWNPPGIQLTVTKPTGGTISGGGVTCGTGGSDCSATLTEGTTVEFEVEPDKGYRFTGFTGDCAPGGVITLNAPRTCGARFEEEIATGPAKGMQLLTIAPPKGGTIIGNGVNCGSAGKVCAVSLEHGTRVQLEAQADRGYMLQVFTGDCKGGETEMIGPRNCGAMFTQTRIAGPAGGAATGGSTATKPGTGDPSGRAGSGTGSGTGSGSRSGSGSGSGSESGTGTPTNTTGEAPAAPGPKRDRDDDPVAPPPPPPPVPPDVQAKKDIAALLERYRTAYEGLNFEGIRHAYPTASAAIRDQFRQYKSLEYAFAGEPKYLQLDPYAGTALVEVPVNQNAQMQTGGARDRKSVARFTLAKRGADNDWVIASVVHK